MSAAIQKQLADALRLLRSAVVNTEDDPDIDAAKGPADAALAACDAEQQAEVDPLRLVVKLEGGLVQWVGSNSDHPIGVVILDYDTEGADADELTSIPQDNGADVDAFARFEKPDYAPGFVDRVFTIVGEG